MAKKTITTKSPKKITDAPKKVEAKVVKVEILDKAKSRGKQSSQLPHLRDGLSSYLEHIQKYPLLTKEQELEIATRYKEHGDPKDAETLVTSNLRFVVKVAAEYSKFGSKLIDLVQEGNMGLMHAVREYNPYKGVKLITYAVWWIRGYIQEHLMRQYSMVRIGTTQNQRKLFYKLKKEKDRLDRMGMEPTVQLLSTNLGVPEKDVVSMQQRMGSRDMSLDQPISGDGTSATTWLEMEAGDDVAVDSQMIASESIRLLREGLENLTDQLNDKEKYILTKRVLSEEPLKLQEIGNEWGVSREAVRQMEARLMKKIKKELLEKTNENPEDK